MIARSNPARGLAGALLAALLVTVWMPGADALAQGKPRAPAPQTEPNAKSPQEQSYAQHMTNGVRLFNSKEYKTAIGEFDAAYRAVPKASPLINQALCYRELKKYPQAVERLEIALDKHSAAMTDADKEAASKTIAEMKALFAFVTIKVAPPDAKVLIDDEEIPRDKLSSPLAVSPGDHQISASAASRVSASKKITVVSSDRVVVELELALEVGTLRVVAAKPTTWIEVDGVSKGPGSWQGELPPGPHTVRAVGETGLGTIDVVAGQATTLDLARGPGPLPPLPPPPKEPNTKKPTEPQKPKTGFYGHLNASVLLPTKHPDAFAGKPPSSGGYFGLRGGYRVHTYAAFEGLVEYGNVEGPDNGAGQDTYSLTTVRFGPSLRLMSPGDLIKFVGTIGGGLSVELMNYEDRAVETPDLCPGTQPECGSAGVDFYAVAEAGLEIDFDHVLIGVTAAGYAAGTKGVDDDETLSQRTTSVATPYSNALLLMFGPRLYIGYAFW